MTSNEKYLIELSKSALLNTTPAIPPKDINWQFMWDKSQEQNITAILASAILKLPSEHQPPNAGIWRNAMLQTIAIMGQKNAEFERIITAFAASEIKPLCLKGVVIKDLYPTPELRTMGDFDILIEKADRQAAEDIFRNRGYEVKKDTLFTEVEYKNINGELFCSLEAEFKTKPEYWDNILRQNVYEKNNRLLLTPTYELAYCIAHAAKHFISSGCGIRNLFDVVILLKSHMPEIDFGTVEKVCLSQGYEKIMYYMLTAAENWYGIKLNADIKKSNPSQTETFIEYMLCYGVFGHSSDDNVLTTQVTKSSGSDVGIFRRIFFPPKKMLAYKYQYLKKYPFLLPVAWVHRFINAVFVNKYSVKGMLKGIDESIGFASERDKWMDKLDLK